MREKPSRAARVYVQLRAYNPRTQRVEHVKNGNIIFERMAPQDVHALIVKAAEQHYRRVAPPVTPKGTKV